MFLCRTGVRFDFVHTDRKRDLGVRDGRIRSSRGTSPEGLERETSFVYHSHVIRNLINRVMDCIPSVIDRNDTRIRLQFMKTKVDPDSTTTYRVGFILNTVNFLPEVGWVTADETSQFR